MAATMGLIKRDVITPVTTVLFVVSTVTGVMLLLHWHGGLVRFAHEWLSIAFSAIAGWHLVKNWRTFLHYFHRNVALAALVLSLAVSLGFTALTGKPDGSGVSPRVIMQALSGASLETAAPVFGLTPAIALERLDQAGFTDARAADTLTTIGDLAGSSSMEVIAVLAATAP